jgi:SagB-type dehydrogenase family enzyme
MKYLLKKNSLLCLLILITFSACNSNAPKNERESSVLTKIEDAQLTYILPPPNTDGKLSVEKALANRRSHRRFQDREISAEELSQILWAAYGVTDPKPNRPHLRGGLRTAPSAGALYPFEIYVAIGKVKGIASGVYKYLSEEHKIIRTIDKDIREELCIAALGQNMVREAPVTVIYSAIFSRMTDKYGNRGRERYVCMDLGHSAQNIYLQAETLYLGTCAIGAFIDANVSEVLQLPAEEEPLYLMPVGHYYK